MQLLGLIGLGGGGAAAGAATAGAAAGGFSLAGLLQGTATVLGVISSISAGNADAEQATQAANDAEREKDLELLQGVERRSSIKRQYMDAVGAQDVAYAASGVDLSFGTAAAARTDANREADYLLTSDVSTEEVRRSRLTERAANARSMAKRARLGGILTGITGGLQGFASIAGRGGPR
jgi:hypothetical protein